MVTFVAANLGLVESQLHSSMEKTHQIRHTDSPRFGRTAIPWMDEGVYQPPGSLLLGHGGGGYGYLAFVGLDVKRKRGVVVLSNQMNLYPPGVGWTLLQEMPLSRENVSFLVREIVGLGVALERDEQSGLLVVRQVYPKSPAGEAGLLPGSVIESINATPTRDKSVQECLELMAGPEGAQVNFRISQPTQRSFRLTKRRFLTTTG